MEFYLAFSWILPVYCLEISVVEYLEPPHEDTFPTTIIKDNFNHISFMVDTAVKNGMNVIIFPECSLGGYSSYSLSKDQLGQYSYKLPKGETSPENLTYKKDLIRFSTLAKTNGVYIIINVIEKSGGEFYNSNIMFDNNGNFIKTMRKRYLTFEKNFSSDHSDCVVEIDSSKFCVLSGNDFFSENLVTNVIEKGVRNFIVTNAWYKDNETDIPCIINNVIIFKFLAINYNVNLFFAGLNINKNEKRRSGIFSKDVDIIGCFDEETNLIFVNFNNGTVLNPSFRYDDCLDALDKKQCRDSIEEAKIEDDDVVSDFPDSLRRYKKVITYYPNNSPETQIEIDLYGIFVDDFVLNGNVTLSLKNKMSSKLKPLLVDKYFKYYTGKKVDVDNTLGKIVYYEYDPNVYFLGFLSWNIKSNIPQMFKELDENIKIVTKIDNFGNKGYSNLPILVMILLFSITLILLR